MAGPPSSDGAPRTVLDAEAVAARPIAGHAPVTGEVTVDVNDGVVVRTLLDPAVQPFLNDHRIEGIPVLPGVMGMEAFAEAALAATRLAGREVGGEHGYRVGSIEDVRFLAPCKFYRDEPRTITVTALVQPDPAGGDDLLATCRLTAERLLAGSSTPRLDVHFTGTVRLTRSPWSEECEDVPVISGQDGQLVEPDAIYRLYFHGPAYQVLAEAGRAGGAAVGRLADPMPEHHVPTDQQTVTGPRLSELCFQTAGLVQAGTTGELALPAAVEAVRLVRDPNHVGGGLHAVLQVRSAAAQGDSSGGSSEGAGPVFDGHVADGEGRVVLRMQGYRTVALPAAMPEDVRSALHRALVG
jgi:hypothetical protein